MGRDTKIAWTDHTFNGVRGCAKVSPGCDTCYAEGMSKRNPKHLGIWGEEGTRVLGGPDYWANLDRWHWAAVRDGALRRVFCYSLGDVFESPRSLANADVCAKGRDLLFAAIERLQPVPHRPFSEGNKKAGLIFLLLTKRPENVKRMVPTRWLISAPEIPPWNSGSAYPMMWESAHLGWPRHVWLGTSVENQPAADERIPKLLAVPGVPVPFLSLEPLLERVNLRRWLDRLGWLIPGGEGFGKRPCDLAWIRDIRDQGKAAGVPVFVKQLGSNPTDGTYAPRPERPLITVSHMLRLEHPKGEDPEEWPEDLRVREVPKVRL